MRLLTTVYIVANAVVFVAFGPIFFIWPDYFAGLIGIQLTDSTAYADFRAMYGGLTCGVGILFVSSLWKPGWVRPALFTIISTSAGLMCGRIYSLLATGSDVGSFIFVSMGLEFAAVVTGIWLYKSSPS